MPDDSDISPNSTLLSDALVSDALPARVDVSIIGAGPTGLMAAALLARSGIQLRIVDKSATAAHESRAFGVHAKSMELFLNMGLADELLDRGTIANGIQMFIDGKQAAEVNLDDIGQANTPFPFIFMLPQSEIEAILLQDLNRLGVKVERNIDVTTLQQRDDGVTLYAKDASGTPMEIESAYLIGADGAHSVVRHLLNLSFKGAPYPQGFLLADCKVDWPLDYDHMKAFLHDRSLAVFLPLKGETVSRVLVTDHSQGDPHEGIETQGSSPVSLEEVHAAFVKVSGINVTFSDVRWTSRYRVHHRSVDTYRKGRVFVAGDAAHIHSPAGGQGMNTGLQDAANLAWKLALAVKGHAGDALLDTYHSERWPVGQNVLKTTDRLFGRITVQSERAAKLRNFLIPHVFAIFGKMRFIRARAFHFLSQLAIRYEPNGFLQGPANNAGPSAGMRAPDAQIAHDLTVFDLIENYRFHVLALSRKPLNEAEIEALTKDLAALPDIGLALETHIIAHSLIGRDARLYRAESPEIFDAYGVTYSSPHAIFLIRPDGHIAFNASSLDVSSLAAFLSARFAGKAA